MKTKIVALKNNEDFKSLLKGHKLSNKYFTIFFKKLSNKNSNFLNVSISTKRKIGNSVERNKIRRKIKAITHDIIKKNSANFNYCYLIIVKKSSILKDEYNIIKKTMFLNFKKLNK